MPFVTVGRENSMPVELYYEDHGSGARSSSSTGSRSADGPGNARNGP